MQNVCSSLSSLRFLLRWQQQCQTLTMPMLLNTSMAVIRNFPLKRVGSAFRGAKADLASADICQVLSLHFRYIQNLTLGTLEKGVRIMSQANHFSGCADRFRAQVESVEGKCVCRCCQTIFFVRRCGPITESNLEEFPEKIAPWSYKSNVYGWICHCSLQ